MKYWLMKFVTKQMNQHLQINVIRHGFHFTRTMINGFIVSLFCCKEYKYFHPTIPPSILLSISFLLIWPSPLISNHLNMWTHQ